MNDDLIDIKEEMDSLLIAISESETAIQDEIANRSFLVRQWADAAARYNQICSFNQPII